MKPMNDDTRKREFLKAGFFTLIPMVLVGCLVWGGMKGDDQKQLGSFYIDTISDARDSIGNVYNLLGKIKLHKDTFEGMMEERKDLEDAFYEAFRNDTSGTELPDMGVVEYETKLESFEDDIEGYLKIESGKIKELDIYQTAGFQITNFQKELNYFQKSREDYIGSSGSEDEQAEKCNERIRKLEEDLEDAMRPCLNLEDKIERLEEKNDELKDNAKEKDGSNEAYKRRIHERLKDVASDIESINGDIADIEVAGIAKKKTKNENKREGIKRELEGIGNKIKKYNFLN